LVEVGGVVVVGVEFGETDEEEAAGLEDAGELGEAAVLVGEVLVRERDDSGDGVRGDGDVGEFTAEVLEAGGR
jgi:hypothetical protein